LQPDLLQHPGHGLGRRSRRSGVLRRRAHGLPPRRRRPLADRQIREQPGVPPGPQVVGPAAPPGRQDHRGRLRAGANRTGRQMGASSFVAGRGYDAAAVAAREAEINGKPQRVEAMALSELPQEAWDVVNTIRSAIGLGPATDMPGYSLTMAKHPEIFRRQLEM